MLTHARRIIRAAADAPSPFASPIRATPDDEPPNRPVAPPPTAIDDLVAPPPPLPAAEARRGTAIPEAPTRDVGGRRPDGRKPPSAAAAATVVLGRTCVCIAIGLFR